MVSGDQEAVAAADQHPGGAAFPLGRHRRLAGQQDPARLTTTAVSPSMRTLSGSSTPRESRSGPAKPAAM
ncbi:hypothetical protein [Actinocatenispora thailandica]|uniref:hypothetical protein n=1 Tax=Actinocatenispora thailandica TaxID=227318 RepID=UPI001EF19D15|nr:hypothetical protein [Actinocatenispora thailandica]